MGRKGIPLRGDFDEAKLRKLARQTKDGKQAVRLLALAAVYAGASRTRGARIGGVGVQILRDWILRFNASGPKGLLDKKRLSKRRLNEEQLAEIRELVIKGPDPQKDHVVRWRCVDLQAIIKQRYGVEYHERTIGKLLHYMGFSHISARPQHPKSDPQLIETFKKNLPVR